MPRKTEERRDQNGVLTEVFETVDGIRDGLTTYSGEAGAKVCEMEFQKGELHGRLSRWNTDGTMILEAQFSAGEHHGEYRSWWNNGNLKEEGTFSHGARIGTYRWYGKDGKLVQEESY